MLNQKRVGDVRGEQLKDNSVGQCVLSPTLKDGCDAAHLIASTVGSQIYNLALRALVKLREDLLAKRTAAALPPLANDESFDAQSYDVIRQMSILDS